MPNYVKHRVRISGSKEVISRFTNEILRSEESEDLCFSFQKVLPRPSSRDIESSSKLEDGMTFLNGSSSEKLSLYERYFRKYKEEMGKKVIESISLGKIGISNQLAYGYPSWYEWNIANWGTKWDACDAIVEVTDGVINLDFQTAWSTCRPVFARLSELYPSLQIEVSYADEDYGYNCGRYRFIGGECSNDELLEDAEFARKLWEFSVRCTQISNNVYISV